MEASPCLDRACRALFLVASAADSLRRAAQPGITQAMSMGSVEKQFPPNGRQTGCSGRGYRRHHRMSCRCTLAEVRYNRPDCRADRSCRKCTPSRRSTGSPCRRPDWCRRRPHPEARAGPPPLVPSRMQRPSRASLARRSGHPRSRRRRHDHRFPRLPICPRCRHQFPICPRCRHRLPRCCRNRPSRRRFRPFPLCFHCHRPNKRPRERHRQPGNR